MNQFDGGAIEIMLEPCNRTTSWSKAGFSSFAEHIERWSSTYPLSFCIAFHSLNYKQKWILVNHRCSNVLHEENAGDLDSCNAAIHGNGIK